MEYPLIKRNIAKQIFLNHDLHMNRMCDIHL